MTGASGEPTRILFVCTGNICRSPSAEAVAARIAEEAGLGSRFAFDSAGTGRWHVGDPPDPRAIEAAARRGYELHHLRARQVDAGDFDRFDLILAMDRGHHRQLLALCPDGKADRLRLFMEFAPSGSGGVDVPDPYYGDEAGFETMLDMIEDGSRGLIDALAGDGAAAR
jgi:protein-tyrosine phosphatase